MELTDYLAAIRRHWTTWVGLTLLGLVLAGVAFAVTPQTYEATARVFVSAQPSINNSAQYVQARVQSYPDVVTSATVLAPAISDLGLHETVGSLARQVSVTVPAGTSELDITVSGRDPKAIAATANAIADRTTTAVQKLETPASGVRPVTLTVSDPAAAPSSPASPRLVYDLALGLLVGLFVGLAAAVLRSTASTALTDEKDVHRAWGPEAGLEVLAPPRGRAAQRSALTGSPTAALARRLEFIAADRQVRVVLLSPSPAESAAARELAEQVAADLGARGLRATIAGAASVSRPLTAEGEGGADVVLTLAEPLAPPSFWGSVVERYDGAVLVVPSGHVAAAELREVRVVLRAAGIEPLAVVVTPHHRHRRGGKAARSAGGVRTAELPAGPEVRPVPSRDGQPRDRQRAGTPAAGGPRTGEQPVQASPGHR